MARRRTVTLVAPVIVVHAEVAELVDALASGASARKGVWVRVPSSVPSPIEGRTGASCTCPGGGIGIRVRLRGV